MKRKGFVIWASIETALETTADRIIDAGFEGALPENGNKAAFGKAVKKIKKLFDAEECALAVKDQRFRNDKFDTRIAIVRPRVEAGTYHSEDFCICRFDGSSVWCETKNRTVEVVKFEEEMRDEYNRQRRDSIIGSSQLRAIYEKATKEMRRIPLRGTQLQFGDKKNGGIYFISDVYLEEINRLKGLFTSIGRGCNIGSMPTYNDDESNSMIQQSADFSYRTKISDLITKISTELSEKSMRRSTVENRQKEAEAILKDINAQRDLMSDAVKKIERDAKTAIKVLNEHLSYAKDNVVSPIDFSAEMDRINAAADAGEVIDDSAELESRISADELTPVSDIWGDDSTVDLSTTKSIWDDLA